MARGYALKYSEIEFLAIQLFKTMEQNSNATAIRMETKIFFFIDIWKKMSEAFEKQLSQRKIIVNNEGSYSSE